MYYKFVDALERLNFHYQNVTMKGLGKIKFRLRNKNSYYFSASLRSHFFLFNIPLIIRT